MNLTRTRWCGVTLLAAMAMTAWGQARFSTAEPDYSTMGPLPDAMERAGFEPMLNNQIPLDLTFNDEVGNPVHLGSFFNDKPVILTLVYFNCPMLCNIILNSTMDTLGDIDLFPGRDYEIVTVSFNHKEGHELAAAKKQAYTKAFGKPGAEDGWHFLTGDEASIKELCDAVGFTFAWDEERKEYAHASGIMLATPGGRLSHYFFGVVFEPDDVRLGLVEASEGTIGTVLDKARLLFCFQYDPNTGAYTPAVFRMIQVGGALTVASLAIFMIGSVRKEKRQQHAAMESTA
jgi:protein SCO1/2